MGVPAMVVMTVASTAASYAQQASAASAQEKYQDAKNDQITKATIENYKELDKAEQDVAYNTAQDSLDNQIAALEGAANQEAFSSATGIRGRSTDMLMQNLARNKAINDSDISMAREQQLNNINTQARSIQNQAEASYDYTPIKKPSAFNAAISGIQTGMSVYQPATSMANSFRSADKVGSGVNKSKGK